MGADYDKICSFQSLYDAHMAARVCKRSKPEVARFEMDLGENLTKLADELAGRTYRMSGYYRFTVYEPKERMVHAAHYRDRVVLHCVCDEVLMPLLERHLIYDNAACRKGKGTHFALDRLSKFLREHYRAHGREGYVLKCDVSKYFASIDQDVLKSALARIVRDPDVLRLLYHVVNSYETEGSPGRGLPLGNQTSQCFALLYLDPMDRLVKERLRVRGYVRYMDDWVLVHHSKEFLREALRAIRQVVEGELNLTLNSKTQIIPLSQGVEFLGWRFFLTDTGKVVRRLRTQSKVRFKRRMKGLARDCADGQAGPEEVRAVTDSYRGHLAHGNARALQEHVLGEFYETLGGVSS